jgi:hypothetical protein
VPVRPTLLALLSASILAMAAPAEEPSAPALPPTSFPQPGGKIKVRVEGKGYLLPESLKEEIAALLAQANFARAREAYLGYRKGGADQAQLEAKLRSAQALATGVAEGLEASRQRHAQLKEKLARLLRDPESAPAADLNTYIRLEAAITATAAQIGREEEAVAAAEARVAEVRLKVDPQLAAVRKLMAEQLETLAAYRRAIENLRAMVMAKGTAL